jgi:hypothetical protein
MEWDRGRRPEGPLKRAYILFDMKIEELLTKELNGKRFF